LTKRLKTLLYYSFILYYRVGNRHCTVLSVKTISFKLVNISKNSNVLPAAIVSSPLVKGQGNDQSYIEGGLEGQAGNSITLENYRAIEAAYAKEFMRATNSHERFSNQGPMLQNFLRP
jgi:hypothetical protein